MNSTSCDNFSTSPVRMAFLFPSFFSPLLSIKGPPPSFDQPIDANVTNVATRPGDLVVVATDGLFDNVELDEVNRI